MGDIKYLSGISIKNISGIIFDNAQGRRENIGAVYYRRSAGMAS